MTKLDYWKECISEASEECGLVITNEQIAYLAGAVDGAEANMSQAFYTPPPSDRYAEIEREWRARVKAIQDELNRYKENAETAIKIALRQYSDTIVTIGKDGEVFRHGGRTEQIQ